MLPDWVFDEIDRAHMQRALAEARAAEERGEVPVGAVVACGGEVLAGAGNRRQADQLVSFRRRRDGQ